MSRFLIEFALQVSSASQIGIWAGVRQKTFLRSILLHRFRCTNGSVIPLPSNFQKLSGLSRRSRGKDGCLTLATNVCLRAGAVKMLIAPGQLKLEPDRKSTRLNSSHITISY